MTCCFFLSNPLPLIRMKYIFSGIAHAVVHRYGRTIRYAKRTFVMSTPMTSGNVPMQAPSSDRATYIVVLSSIAPPGGERLNCAGYHHDKIIPQDILPLWIPGNAYLPLSVFPIRPHQLQAGRQNMVDSGRE